MYAIVQSGGRQFKVSCGEKIITSLKDPFQFEAGKLVKIDTVLGFGDGNTFKVGSPFVGGVVHFKVLRAFKQNKVLVFKKNRRKRYRRLNGHRQQCVELICEKIDCK